MKIVCLYSKLLASLICATVVCSFFCFFYYNPPLHCPSHTGSTAHTGRPYSFYSIWKEGRSYGITDEKGFCNQTSVSCDNIGILLMGNSHMEAFQVLQNESCSSIANERLPSSLQIFNIGRSGHDFFECIYRMRSALDEFAPKKYVILATNCVEFENQLLIDAINGDYRPSNDNVDTEGVSNVRRYPFLRALGRQYLEINHKNLSGIKQYVDPTEFPKYFHHLELWLSRISECAAEHNVQPIVLYHSHFIFQNGPGEVHYQTENPRALVFFRQACEANGIIFIDMSEDFERHFRETYEPAYGFINTAPGRGHLNKVGHRLIADRLYKEIMEMEGLAE